MTNQDPVFIPRKAKVETQLSQSELWWSSALQCCAYAKLLTFCPSLYFLVPVPHYNLPPKECGSCSNTHIVTSSEEVHGASMVNVKTLFHGLSYLMDFVHDAVIRASGTMATSSVRTKSVESAALCNHNHSACKYLPGIV